MSSYENDDRKQAPGERGGEYTRVSAPEEMPPGEFQPSKPTRAAIYILAALAFFLLGVLIDRTVFDQGRSSSIIATDACLSGEAEGAQAAADQVAGDRLPGNAPAGTSPRGDSPERGVNAPAAVAHQGANAPGQSVAAATGADAAAATGGSVRGVPPGPTGQALGDGNQAPGSAGIQGGEAQAVQARPGMQGPTPSETQMLLKVRREELHSILVRTKPFERIGR